MTTSLAKSLFDATGAAVALLFLANPALADTGNGTYDCNDSLAADKASNPSYVACSINWTSGALAPVTPPPAVALPDPFPGYSPPYGDFYFAGQSVPGSSGGPFVFDFDTTATPYIKGSLTLVPQIQPFVIALASNDTYSLFLYDPAKAASPVSQVFFDTFGTTGVGGGPYPLQYANLYAQAIPEPATHALMLAGLSVLGLTLRHRRA